MNGKQEHQLGPANFPKDQLDSLINVLQVRWRLKSELENERTNEKLREMLQTKLKEQDDLILDLNLWFDTFTRLLLLSETRDERCLSFAVRAVRFRLNEEAVRRALITFAVPVTHRGLVSKVRRRIQSFMLRYTVFQKMTRVWVYLCANQALDYAQFLFRHQLIRNEAVPSPDICPLLPLPDYLARRARCPLEGPAGPALIAQAAECRLACRVCFLDWMRFSEYEIAAALDKSRSWVHRWLQDYDTKIAPENQPLLRRSNDSKPKQA